MERKEIKEESLKDKFIFYKLFNEDEGTFLNELQKIEKMYVGEIYGNNYR